MDLNVLNMGGPDAFLCYDRDANKVEYLFDGWDDWCVTQSRLMRGDSVVFEAHAKDGTIHYLQALPGAVREAMFGHPYPQALY